MFKKIFQVTAIITLILILDQYSKYLVSKSLRLNSSISIIKNIFRITFVRNNGIAFGVFSNRNSIFIALTVILIGFLLFFSKVLIQNFRSRAGFSLIFAGAIGNLIDRIRQGYIIDFLDFRIWPVFNISDVSIVIGVIFLCIQYCLK